MEWRWTLWVIIACVSIFSSSVFLSVAVGTAYWLETAPCWRPIDHISRLGLWEVCFEFYSDPTPFFGPDFQRDGCLLFQDHRLKIYRSDLLPAFFVATQALFAMCVVFHILGIFLLVLLPAKRSWRNGMVLAIFSMMTLASVTGFLAIVVFGSLATSFRWVTDVDKVHLSWSYWLALTGVILEVIATVFFGVHLASSIPSTPPSSVESNNEDVKKGTNM